jgi:hypothetical protein
MTNVDTRVSRNDWPNRLATFLLLFLALFALAATPCRYLANGAASVFIAGRKMGEACFCW